MPAAAHSELLKLQRDVVAPRLFELIHGRFAEAVAFEVELLEGRVHLEHIGDVLHTLRSELIVVP